MCSLSEVGFGSATKNNGYSGFCEDDPRSQLLGSRGVKKDSVVDFSVIENEQDKELTIQRTVQSALDQEEAEGIEKDLVDEFSRIEKRIKKASQKTKIDILIIGACAVSLSAYFFIMNHLK